MTKQKNTPDEGQQTAQCDKAKCDQLADELEGLVKAGPKAAGPVGSSIFEHFDELVAALRSADPVQIARALRNALNHLLGEESGAVPALAAGRRQGAAGFDWQKLLAVLLQILPLLFQQQP